MKAVVTTRYGSPDVLQVQEMEKPTPKENEILVRVFTASVTAADTMMRMETPRLGRLFIGLTKPKKSIPGTEFSGEVESAGKEVARFKPGDLVFGGTGLKMAAHAEYLCMAEDGVVAIKPAIMSHAQAAPVCDGALTSMNFLTDLANLQSGQRVLINGASGGVGSAAVEIAKHIGAEVTGVCSTANVEIVKALGADHVIDYTQEDFTKSGQSYELIYDTVGKSSFAACKGALTKHGAYISPVLGLALLFQMLWTTVTGTKKAKFSATGLRPAAELKRLLAELMELIEAGKVTTVIDRSYPMEQIVEAHRYVDKGHKRGNVVITVGG